MTRRPWSSPELPSEAQVDVWSVRGTRADLDVVLRRDVAARLGDGLWTRRCTGCGRTDHGARVFVPTTGRPVTVTVSHAGPQHVAATGWGRLDLGIDLVTAIGPPGALAHDADAWLPTWIAAESLARLHALPAGRRAEGALALWAAREAFAKREGSGLDDTAVDVPLLEAGSTPNPANGPLAAMPYRSRGGRHRGWWLRPAVPGHVCVLSGSEPFRVVPVAATVAGRVRVDAQRL